MNQNPFMQIPVLLLDPATNQLIEKQGKFLPEHVQFMHESIYDAGTLIYFIGGGYLLCPSPMAMVERNVAAYWKYVEKMDKNNSQPSILTFQ